MARPGLRADVDGARCESSDQPQFAAVVEADSLAIDDTDNRASGAGSEAGARSAKPRRVAGDRPAAVTPQRPPAPGTAH